MSKTMKEFITTLQKEHPEELLVVSKGPLKPHEQEPFALLFHMEQLGKYPMGLFEHVVTYNGNRWPGLFQIQADGTYSKMAIACDIPQERWNAKDMVDTLLERTTRSEKPVFVPEKQAYCKDTVIRGDECSFFDLPIYRKDEKDARPGWLCGVGIGKDLKCGRYNLSWHRFLVHGPQHSAVRIQYRHLWQYMQEYKAAGYKEMPTVWLFGAHPALMLAGGFGPSSYDMDEYDYAAGLLNGPLRVTPSTTWGEEFLIPADAEVVVEGYTHCYESTYNGPWVDFMRYYSPQTLEPVFRPTAFNFAHNPVFDAHIARHDLYSGLSTALGLTKTLRAWFPNVRFAYMPAPFCCVIQFKPLHPGQSQRLAHLALVALSDIIKNVIIVDEDINPLDLTDVLFAIGTRVDANTAQVQKMLDLSANRHDPAPVEFCRVGGLIIDATKPTDKPFPEIGTPDHAVLERIRLSDYVSLEEQQRILSGLGANVGRMAAKTI